MSQKPEKPPIPAEAGQPASGEIAWIALFFAFCLLVNAWLAAASQPAPAPAPARPAAKAPVLATPAPPAFEAPSRDRPESPDRRERQTRESGSLPARF